MADQPDGPVQAQRRRRLLDRRGGRLVHAGAVRLPDAQVPALHARLGQGQGLVLGASRVGHRRALADPRSLAVQDRLAERRRRADQHVRRGGQRRDRPLHLRAHPSRAGRRTHVAAAHCASGPVWSRTARARGCTSARRWKLGCWRSSSASCTRSPSGPPICGRSRCCRCSSGSPICSAFASCADRCTSWRSSTAGTSSDLRRRKRRARRLVDQYLHAVVRVAQYSAYERVFALWHWPICRSSTCW